MVGRGCAYRSVQVARTLASGTEVMLVGSGGSIPIVPALARSVSQTESWLVARTDKNNIPGPTERFLLDELEKALITEAKFVREFATGRSTAVGAP